MLTHAGRWIRALSLAALLALGQGGLSNAASPSIPIAPSLPADGTLTVVPSIISAVLKPGDTNTTELTLHAGVALDVHIAADGLGQGPDGGFEPLTPDKDTSPYTARPMITFDPQSFLLPANAERKVTVKVAIPRDVGDGARYAILKVTGIPATGSENVGIGVELGVTTLVTLASTTQTHKGSIAGLAVDQSTPGQIGVTGTVMNGGNSHFGAAPDQVYTLATLHRADGGGVVASDRTTLTGNSTVPTFGRSFTVPLKPAHALADGRYHLEVEAGLQDGTVLDRAALDFDLAGGAVLGATGVPSQGPPATPGASSDGLTLILSGVLVGVLGVLILLGLLRGRRTMRRRTMARATGTNARSSQDERAVDPDQDRGQGGQN